uniref:Uncharacterized protein n=1 Tax=Cucumis melo subsp. melo TaxID=412675 RepID=E5GC97_CUCME|nr:hypothetical protein [Cucumis melo subsp. melo]
MAGRGSLAGSLGHHHHRGRRLLNWRVLLFANLFVKCL